MKVISFFSFIAVFTLYSCSKPSTPPLTKEEIKQKVDSITKSRIKELDEMSERDLQHRIKIEVKIAADSIVKATNNKKVRKDTTVGMPIPVKPSTPVKIDSGAIK